MPERDQNRALQDICLELEEQGSVIRVGNGFKFIGPFDFPGLRKLEEEHEEEGHKMARERDRKQLEAWKQRRREGGPLLIIG